jgi:hypothetical protein
MSIPSFVAFNWFPNNTCQLFPTFPISYKIQSTPQARLCFPQRIFPNASQCCMPDLDYLLDKLNTASTISVNLLTHLRIVVDNHGYLVTVSIIYSNIVRFYPTDLTIVDQSPLDQFGTIPLSISYYNETYYVGFNNFIVAIDSNDFTTLNYITAPNLSEVNDNIFLNNGEIMVVASTGTASIFFFNRSDNYSLIYERPVSYPNPLGLLYVNDSFFYATSLYDNTIYSYSAINDSGMWTETLFLDARPLVSSPNGYHLIIDECDRYWFVLGNSGIMIFNNQGLLLGNFTQINLIAFDAIITDNYVIYISDQINNRIIRIDPNIQC